MSDRANVQFYVYDSESGIIVRRGKLPGPKVDAIEPPPGRVLVRGRAPQGHRVNLATGELEQAPARGPKPDSLEAQLSELAKNPPGTSAPVRRAFRLLATCALYNLFR